MIIHRIVVGPLETNCYIVQGVIIDPGDEPEKILDVIKENDLEPKQIILTHSHFDHIGALEELKKEFGIEVNNDDLEIIETPGHSKDGICIIVEGHIFTGDTLFNKGIGRTDLPGGDYNQIQKSLKRLMEFPDHFQIHPGHGPESTIGEERSRLF